MTEDERAPACWRPRRKLSGIWKRIRHAGHFERLRSGGSTPPETSALHLDALRDLKQVNTHLVAAAAYPVLEGKGELLTSRLRQND